VLRLRRVISWRRGGDGVYRHQFLSRMERVVAAACTWRKGKRGLGFQGVLLVSLKRKVGWPIDGEKEQRGAPGIPITRYSHGVHVKGEMVASLHAIFGLPRWEREKEAGPGLGGARLEGSGGPAAGID
jgi:hypothetical protein